MNWEEVKTKLTSDRLWALGAYVVLVVLNAKIGFGISPEQMTEVLYAILAFVLGKSIRGTTAGNLLASAIPQVTALLGRKDPDAKPAIDLSKVADAALTVAAAKEAADTEPSDPGASDR